MTTVGRHKWSLGYLWLLCQAHLIRTIVRLTNLEILKSRNSTSSLLKQFEVKKSVILIPSREKGRNIKAQVYTPVDDGFNAVKRPAHVNWHGSGFVMPMLGSDVHFCSYLAATLRISVIDADYRKAPEHVFPACVEDAEDVMLYVFAQETSWKTSNITIGGFSAGGNLALGQASKLSSRVRAVVAVYPPTDFRPLRPERIAPQKCKGALPEWMVILFEKAYILPEQDCLDPLLSVMLCKSEDLPPVLFVSTGKGDTLYNEGKIIVEKAQLIKHTDATFYPVEGVGHAWDKSATGDVALKRDKLYQSISNAMKRSWT